MCGWSVFNYTDPDRAVQDWTATERIPDGNEGPDGDHSYSGEGTFLYLDAKINSNYSKSILQSPQLDGTQKKCFKLSYFMSGGGGSIDVYSKWGLEGEMEKSLLSISDDHGEKWNLAQAQLTGDVNELIHVMPKQRGFLGN